MNEYPNPEVKHNTGLYMIGNRNTRLHGKLGYDSRLTDVDKVEIERAAKQYGLNPYQKNLFYGSRLFEGKSFGSLTPDSPVSGRANDLAGSLKNSWSRWGGNKNKSYIDEFVPRWVGLLDKNNQPFPVEYYQKRGIDTLRSDMNMAPSLRIMMEEGTDEDRYLLEHHKKGESGFNPEGKGFDMETALMSGSKPNAEGHWGSLNPKTGRVLKGRQHKTWDLMEEEEHKRGNAIIKKADGRYYSVRGIGR